MKIRLAKTAGFCMGVRRAVDMVLDLRRDSTRHSIVTYGPLIHNPQTLEVLRSKGIQEAQSIDEIGEGTVVIRAHGISPAERTLLEQKGVLLIDATCPRVARVQAVIRKHAGKGHFCVIVGDKNHPEVRGLMGFASAGGMTVPSEHEVPALDEVPSDQELCVVAQTTQDLLTFQRVVEKLKERFAKLHVYNTICDSTKKRQAEVGQLANQADLIVVVGGKGSGNTQRLVQVAQAQGVGALHVETEDEIPEEALSGAHVVAVTAGASTPNWQIRRVIDRLKEIGRTRETGLFNTMGKIAEVAVMTYIPTALGGAGLTAACLALQGRRAAWLPVLVAALFVFSMHLVNRVQDSSGAVRFNTPNVAAFYARHRFLLTCLGVLSSLGVLCLSYQLGPYGFLLAMAMMITGRLYSVPLLPRSKFPKVPWRSMKDIPGLKTPLVAVGWAICAVVLPVTGSDLPLQWTSLVISFIFTAGMVFWRTALSDLLDIQGDRIVGRATIPILTGPKRTGRILVGLLILLALMLFVGAATGMVTPVGYLLILNAGLFGIFYLVYKNRHLVDRLLLEGMLDGNLMLAGLVAMVYGMN